MTDMPLPRCYRCHERITPRGTCACADGIALVCGDCREVLPLLEKESVELVLSDPPYGIGYQYGGGVRGIKAAVRITKHATARGCPPIVGDDKPFDPRPFLGFPRVLLWGADHFAQHLPRKGTFIAWDKSVGIGPRDTFVDCEFAWCNWREPRNVFRFLWKGLTCMKRGEEHGRRDHPTQKPLALLRWCVERAGGNGMIFDPFAGVATTGAAAKLLGRKCLMIEIEERYCKVAAARLRQNVLNWEDQR